MTAPEWIALQAGVMGVVKTLGSFIGIGISPF